MILEIDTNEQSLLRRALLSQIDGLRKLQHLDTSIHDEKQEVIQLLEKVDKLSVTDRK